MGCVMKDEQGLIYFCVSGIRLAKFGMFLARLQRKVAKVRQMFRFVLLESLNYFSEVWHIITLQKCVCVYIYI
jgi:hypothetical protein